MRTPLLRKEVVTEFAAYGIACVLIPLYAHLRVLRVALVGDRFDYWVGNGEEELGLEVSGTMTANLEWLRGLRSKPVLTLKKHNNY